MSKNNLVSALSIVMAMVMTMIVSGCEALKGSSSGETSTSPPKQGTAPTPTSSAPTGGGQKSKTSALTVTEVAEMIDVDCNSQSWYLYGPAEAMERSALVRLCGNSKGEALLYKNYQVGGSTVSIFNGPNRSFADVSKNLKADGSRVDRKDSLEDYLKRKNQSTATLNVAIVDPNSTPAQSTIMNNPTVVQMQFGSVEALVELAEDACSVIRSTPRPMELKGLQLILWHNCAPKYASRPENKVIIQTIKEHSQEINHMTDNQQSAQIQDLYRQLKEIKENGKPMPQTLVFGRGTDPGIGRNPLKTLEPLRLA